MNGRLALNPMNQDTKHTIGALLMWGGVALAAVATFLVLPRLAWLGITLLAVSIPLAGFGAWWKKRHCPRCRAGACEIKPQSNSND